MNLEDAPISNARHICVYGPPKAGKTEKIGALAEHYKLWWFDLDGGAKTLRRPDSAAKPYLKNIEYFRIPDTQLYPIAIETMLKVIKGGACKICYAHGKVDCPLAACKAEGAFGTINVSTLDPAKDIVVIDSYSQLMDSCINFIKKNEIAKDDFGTEWSDWRKQGGMSDRICTTIQNAPWNCVITSHEILTPQQDGSKKIAPIGGTRNFSADFAKFFDDVIYCEVVNGKFKAMSMPQEKSNAVIGSRTGKKLTNDKSEQLGLIELFKGE